jgi:acetyl-CoA carboxylase carboxyltransferase component
MTSGEGESPIMADDEAKDWTPEVAEIEQRRALASQMGGPDQVARQHAAGKLSVRERIESICDKGSFRERGGLSGVPSHDETGKLDGFSPANVVLGMARVEGRPAVVCGDDFTLRGAAYTPASLRKGQYAEMLAIQSRVPLIRLLEAGGASVAGATGTKGRSGYDLVMPEFMNPLAADAMATIPVACAALGPVAGFPAGRLAAAHFSVMTRHTAQVLTGGPALVERAHGETLSKEELGGAAIHERSGVVDNVVEDEVDAMRAIRRFLSYLPSSVYARAPQIDTGDVRDREESKLLSIVPRNRRRAFKVRRVIDAIVDRGSFFEFGTGYGRSQVTGFAHVNTEPVGVLANDGYRDGGSMTAAAARKIRRFIELCDAFGLPIVSLVDEPGFAIGRKAEEEATIRFGMEALFAALQSTVPWFAVLMRRSFGVAQGIHYGPGATVVAWPSAETGALPVESGVALAYRREIEAAEDPEARRRELEDEIAAAQSVFPRAEDFGVHDVIDPRQTRPVLCDWLDEIQPRLETRERGPRRYSMRP